MTYNDDMPEFMKPVVVNLVNRRHDITGKQAEKLDEIYREMKIPQSAIVRLALNCFLPKLRDENFRYGGIKELWDRNKF